MHACRSSPCLAYSYRSIRFSAPFLIRYQFEILLDSSFRAQKPLLDASKAVDLKENAEKAFMSRHKEIGQNPWNFCILRCLGTTLRKQKVRED